jgi:hypothetical protein
MPNSRATFVTTRPGGSHGSSLYMVTAHWVLRCSGNTNGRTAETFIRKRDCSYKLGNVSSQTPSVGASSVEGGHTGNEISEILSTGATLSFPVGVPATWVANNGVTWAVAVAEVDAAMLYAQTMSGERASRKVGGQFRLD